MRNFLLEKGKKHPGNFEEGSLTKIKNYLLDEYLQYFENKV